LIQAASIARPSVVGVFSEQENSYALEDKQWADQEIQKEKQKHIVGSAFFIDKNWYLLTSKHVVPNTPNSYSVVLDDGRSFPIQTIWMDPDLDLAVLYIWQDKNQISFPVVTIINDEGILPIGQFALTIGTPFSQYNNTVSFGNISGIWRTLTLDWGSVYTWLYQLDINTNPWNSWGPVVTSDWTVFGIVTAMASQSSHIGFALPISQRLILNILSKSKK
jgi:S1-C subfamily serine protease